MDSVATPRLFIGADVELRAEQLAAPLFTRIDGCALTSISRRSKALRPIRRRPFWTFQLQNGRHCGTHFGRKNLLLSQTLDVLIPPRAVQAADDWSASQLCGRQRRQIRRMSCLVRAIYWAVGAKRGGRHASHGQNGNHRLSPLWSAARESSGHQRCTAGS